MKYRVDLYFSGTITQFVEANDRQSAYKEAEWEASNMNTEEFYKELDLQSNGHEVYEEGEY